MRFDGSGIKGVSVPYIVRIRVAECHFRPNVPPYWGSLDTPPILARLLQLRLRVRVTAGVTRTTAADIRHNPPIHHPANPDGVVVCSRLKGKPSFIPSRYTRGKLYYRYASGECDFWEPIEDNNGKEVTLARVPLDAKDLKKLGL